MENNNNFNASPNFWLQMEQEAEKARNISITENGALGHLSTYNPIVDMNFKTSSYRNLPDEEILVDFIKAFRFDALMALRWLFFARDIREGMGERRLFRVCFGYVAANHHTIAIELLPLIAEYGRYDDLFSALGFNAAVDKAVLKLINKTLSDDLIKHINGRNDISLLAKWMPSENASSPKTKKLARYFAKELKVTPRKYRLALSTLRKQLQVVERKMSANEWGDIEYKRVPSYANLRYSNAFLLHDEGRRVKYLQDVKTGKAKINAGVLYPHDIVNKYGLVFSWSGGYTEPDATLEELWKNLPRNRNLSETIVVADGSGSMTFGGSSGIVPLMVANALAIYFAETNVGDFKGKYITFSRRPQLVELNGATLFDNIKTALRYNEMSNTNIEAVFDLLLNTAISNNTAAEDLPKRILIISDMEFDAATSGYGAVDKTLFKTIEEKYAKAGYTMPKLVFWNVMSRTNTIPVVENDVGVALVSGFSPIVAEMVMSEKVNPTEILMEKLESERYDAVERAYKTS